MQYFYLRKNGMDEIAATNAPAQTMIPIPSVDEKKSIAGKQRSPLIPQTGRSNGILPSGHTWSRGESVNHFCDV